MNAIGTTENPLRVAIVGSGPSGFYTAGHLLKSKSHPELVAQVDLYDRLPTPWGLVRGGVAPDHPNIKAVSRVYEKTAQHPEFRFHGNVELGRDIGATGAPRPLSRSGLRDGRRDRQAAGHPRGGPRRQLGGHRVRCLVQRPSGLSRPRVRPLRRARRRDRQRERGRRRGADARAHPRGAGDHRCGRPRARGRSARAPSGRSWCSGVAVRRRRHSPTRSCSSSAR